jgi:hypothetical protein
MGLVTVTDTQHVEHAARGARTQSLFRDVNERILEVNEAFSIALELGDWICECADDACTERVALTMEEYEAVRASPIRFAVAPADKHFYPELEMLVLKHQRFWIVEKIGTAGECREG